MQNISPHGYDVCMKLHAFTIWNYMRLYDLIMEENGPWIKRNGSFLFVPPSLVGAFYLHPPPPPPTDARAIFLQNDLLCNDTCSVTGGRKTYWGGGHKRKRSKGIYIFFWSWGICNDYGRSETVIIQTCRFHFIGLNNIYLPFRIIPFVNLARSTNNFNQGQHNYNLHAL